MNDIKVMNHAADNIRILAASMVEKANSGHPGGAMGGSDFINVLFSEYLVYDPADPTWTGRDRFFLDPGHMSPMLYAGLALRGFFSMEDLKQFRQWGSVTPGHPELDLQRGIENSSGPLGQGHALAAGAAVAEKFLEARLGSTMMQHKIYAYISDGAVEEEISQGVGRIAGNLGLNNLIMFYDSNDIQLSTECGVVMNEDTEMKQKTDYGVKAKTIGKMLDDQLTVEGLFSIVLMAESDNGRYYFRTQTNGNDTVKSPIGMFEREIDNDLKQADQKIREYWGI